MEQSDLLKFKSKRSKNLRQSSPKSVSVLALSSLALLASSWLLQRVLQKFIVLSMFLSSCSFNIQPWYGLRYSRMDQVKFVEKNLQEIWSDLVCLSTPYHFKFFKGCLPQVLLGPFLNILNHMLFILTLSLLNHFSPMILETLVF